MKGPDCMTETFQFVGAECGEGFLPGKRLVLFTVTGAGGIALVHVEVNLQHPATLGRQADPVTVALLLAQGGLRQIHATRTIELVKSKICSISSIGTTCPKWTFFIFREM